MFKRHCCWQTNLWCFTSEANSAINSHTKTSNLWYGDFFIFKNRDKTSFWKIFFEFKILSMVLTSFLSEKGHKVNRVISDFLSWNHKNCFNFCLQTKAIKMGKLEFFNHNQDFSVPLLFSCPTFFNLWYKFYFQTNWWKTRSEGKTWFGLLIVETKVLW